MLKNWLKIAFVNYKKNWLSTIINIVGLSLGMCVFLLVFINWIDEKSYEQWNPNKNDIFLVENQSSVFGAMPVSSFPMLSNSKEKYSEIIDYAICNSWGAYKVKLMADGQTYFTNQDLATPNFFEFFPFENVAGDFKSALSDKSKIAISEETAESLFGDDYKNAIGKIIKIDVQDVKSYVVSAIYKLPKENTVFKPGYILRHPDLDRSDFSWTNYSYVSYFKLKPGTNRDQLTQKITKDLNEQEKISAAKWGEVYDEKENTKVFLTPLTTMKLDAISEGVEKADKKSLLILLGLSGLILILSGINLINLKTAQASQRAKEVGVRKSIGSSRSGLITQFLLENLILCLFSFVIALALIELLLPSYNQFLNKDLKLDNPDLFLYSGILMLIFAVISGLIPAVYLSNFKPINTLKGNFSRSKHGVWLRNSILTLQLVISSFFIICSLIINHQVRYMMNKELGFRGDQVIRIDFKKTDWNNNFNYHKYLRLKNQISKIPGVEDVSTSVFKIGVGLMNTSSVKNAIDTSKIINNVANGGIDYNFFRFYKMKWAAGKDLDLRKASDTISGTVANQAFVKQMGWSPEQAIGKEVYPGWEDKKAYKILGVVEDFYVNGVDKPVGPMLMFNYDRGWIKNSVTNLQIKISKNDIDGTLAQIKEFWLNKAEPGYPYDYQFVDKEFAKTFVKFQKQQTLFTTLNAIVLVVALLGLFALSSLLIEQKLKDVAIKKTLGANEKTIVWDLTKRFLLMTVLGVVLSFPMAYYAMNEWLKDFAYRIDMPIWPYVLSLLLLLVLTFFVVSIKAYRATKINLVKYLKYE